jgi:hypothetical protein
LKNFNELKNSENNLEIWKIKDFELFVNYDFKKDVFIESPKKILKNRIPIPNNNNLSDIKKKIIRHDSQILDCDSRNLKRVNNSVRKDSDKVSYYNYFYKVTLI